MLLAPPDEVGKVEQAPHDPIHSIDHGTTPNKCSHAWPIGIPTGTLSTVSDSAPRGIDMVIHGRSSSLMPSGATTRAHTCSTGASMMLCRSTIIAFHGIRWKRVVGDYVLVEPDR
jgi:hypothetical protein